MSTKILRAVRLTVQVTLMVAMSGFAGAATLTSFSQASQNWNGQAAQPHCTQTQAGGGALTVADCALSVASGSLGAFGSFASTYSSSSSAFADMMALGAAASLSNGGDHDREAAEVLASAIASFDTRHTINIPGVAAGTGILLDLDFLVTGSATELTTGNIALNAQSQLLLGIGPGYNVSFDQIGAGVYHTQGYIFTGQPFHVNAYLSVLVSSAATAIGGDVNNPFGFPFGTSADLDFVHTVRLSGASVSLAGQPVTGFVLLDESGNPISFGAPEPGTLAMAALALTSLALRLRKGRPTILAGLHNVQPDPLRRERFRAQGTLFSLTSRRQRRRRMVRKLNSSILSAVFGPGRVPPAKCHGLLAALARHTRGLGLQGCEAHLQDRSRETGISGTGAHTVHTWRS